MATIGALAGQLREGEQAAGQDGDRRDLLEQARQAHGGVVGHARHAQAPVEDVVGHVQQIENLQDGHQDQRRAEDAGGDGPQDVELQVLMRLVASSAGAGRGGRVRDQFVDAAHQRAKRACRRVACGCP
jgi:hypothetical protein